jgi:hypothetical protein
MSPEKLKQLFPNASADLLAANCPEGSRQNAEPQSTVRPSALAAAQGEARNPGRFLVRVTSVRKRLLDEDNLVAKYHIDCCRYAGLIPGDDPASASIQVRQRKCAKGEEEHTVVEIWPLDSTGLSPTL